MATPLCLLDEMHPTLRRRIHALVDHFVTEIVDAMLTAELTEVLSMIDTRRPATSVTENRMVGRVHYARPRRSVQGRPPNPERHAALTQRALEWQRQIETGEIASRAAIARREGLSRARVTQIMNVLQRRA